MWRVSYLSLERTVNREMLGGADVVEEYAPARLGRAAVQLRR
jgi:hypothetical protein